MIEGFKQKQAEALLAYLKSNSGGAVNPDPPSNVEILAGLILCFFYTSLEQIIEDMNKNNRV